MSARDANESHRATSPLEALFDLTFVVAVAQVADQLGEKITTWLSAHPGVEIVDKIVTQSSDEAFHCLAITLFFNDPK